MSKLYDVISRLEEIAAKEDTEAVAADIPFQPVEPVKKGPWLRIVLLSGALTLAGIIVLAITFWWKDLLPFKAKVAVEQVATEPLPTVPTVSQATTMEKQSEEMAVLQRHEQQESPGAPRVKPPESTSAPGTGHTDSSPSVQTVDEQLIVLRPQAIKRSPAYKAEDSDTLESEDPVHLDESAALTVSGEETHIHVDLNNQRSPIELGLTILEPRPLSLSQENLAVLPQRSTDNTFKIKQWLNQAEQRRKVEDWQGAATLYRRIWEISNRPAVANNLAASLLQLGRVDEARDILNQALAISPNDPDLKANLEMTQPVNQAKNN